MLDSRIDDNSYLETVSELKEATFLYQKLGFHSFDTSIGNTEHKAKMNIFFVKLLN